MSDIGRAIAGFSSVGAILDVTVNGMQFMLQASELLFPMASIIYGTIGREVGIGFLTSDQLGYLVVFLATLYVTNLALEFRQGLQNGDFED